MNNDLIPCKYATVRFYPSQERDEFLNVGVVLHAQDATGRLEVRFLQRFGNLKLFVPERERSIISGLRTILKDLELGLDADSADAKFLDNLAGRFQRQLQFSDVRQTLADDIALKVEELFDIFVSVEARERDTRDQVDRRRLKADFPAAFRDRQVKVKTGDEAVLPGARISQHAFDFIETRPKKSPKCLQTLSFDITNLDFAYDALRALRGSIEDVRRKNDQVNCWAAILPPRTDGAVWRTASEFLTDGNCQVRNLREMTALEVVDEFAGVK
jgi:hypothetical protein